MKNPFYHKQTDAAFNNALRRISAISESNIAGIVDEIFEKVILCNDWYQNCFFEREALINSWMMAIGNCLRLKATINSKG